MKKITFALLLILSLALSACGAGAATETSPSALNTDYENALSVQLQLSVGTFKLEEGDLAVDAAQAADLLPLWQVLKSLTESGSAAQEEIDALILQIEETMTAEQIEAIAAMQLTREEMGAVMQEYGLTVGTGENAVEGATPGMGRGGSGVPGMGGGPGGGGGETGLTPDQIATMQAEREKNGETGSMINSRLSGVIIEGLIELLQNK